MSKKLYVGNLSYRATEADLEQLFAAAGTVQSVSIITDKFSGQSRGFGFVEMSSEEEARDAIQRFNNYDLKGRSLRVNEARPTGDRGPRNRPPRSGPGGGRPRDSRDRDN